MICCERCNVWQHGPCVGVMSENEAPDIYYCEECRPDLHELGNRNLGYLSCYHPSRGANRVLFRHRQSRWIGSSIPQQPTRRKKSSASSAQPQGSLKADSLSPDPSDKDTNTSNSKERKPSPKKRSTMNSRDAAYDYSSLFPAPTSAMGDDDTKMEDVSSPPASRSGDSRSRRRGGKRLAGDDDDDDTPSISRSQKRRRESNETEDQTNDNNNHKSKRSSRRADSDGGKDDSSSDQQHQHQGSTTPILLDAPPTLRTNGKHRSNNSKRRPPPPTTAKSERIDSEEPPLLTPTLRRPLDDIIRPARARIPQARSGLNEMRKRVGAILEFVGRLQAEVTPEASSPRTCPSVVYQS